MGTSKPKFTIGERVLCFEPDQSKARVLYDAKILDIDFVREGKTRKEPEYKIHFQGWNSTWDRWANESFVMKDSDDNRKLQRKLAKRAIKKLKNQSHGRKKVYLPGVANVIKRCSDPLSDSDSCSDDGKPDDSDGLSSSDEEQNLPVKRRRKKSAIASSKQSDDVMSNADAAPLEDASSVSSTSHSRRCPPLDIPPSLLRRLEEDNIMIKNKNKLVDLPAKLSIVQILENYAKYFALYVAKLPSSEKTMKSGSQTTDFIPPEKNLNLSKETCQELRVLFDFILPVVLLYDSEQDQFRELVNRSRTCRTDCESPVDARTLTETQLSPQSPRYRFSPPCPPEDEQGCASVTSSEVKKVESPIRKKPLHHRQFKVASNPRQHKKSAEEQTIEETHTYLLPHQPKLDRTGLASDSQGRRRSSRLTHNLKPTSSTEDFNASSPTQEDAVCKDLLISLDCLLFIRAPSRHTHGVKSEKEAKSPMPLLCRDDDRHSCYSPTISLSQICQEVYVGSAGDDVKKALHLAQTWKFRLFPADYEPPSGATVPLSLIYGIHHFLRLFIKLPQIFMKMNVPDFKIKIIYKHLQSLLKFLSEYESEIFSASGSYVNV